MNNKQQGHSIEDYHQDQHQNHQEQNFSHVVIPPRNNNYNNNTTTRSFIPDSSPPPSFNNNHAFYQRGSPPSRATLGSSVSNHHQYDMFHIPPTTHKIKKQSKTSQQYGSNNQQTMHHHQFPSQVNHPSTQSNPNNTSIIRKNKPLLFHNIQYDSTSLKPSHQTMLTHPSSFNSSHESSFSSSTQRQLFQITTTDPVPQHLYQKSNKQHNNHAIPTIQSHSFIDNSYPPSKTSSKKSSNQDVASQSCMFHWKVQSTNYTASSTSSSNNNSSKTSAHYSSAGSPTIPPFANSNNTTRSNPFPLLSTIPGTYLEEEPHHIIKAESQIESDNNFQRNAVDNPQSLKLPTDSEHSNSFLQQQTEQPKPLLNQNSTNKEEKRAKTNRTRISIRELL